MSRGFVYQQGVLAGVLERCGQMYHFKYEHDYLVGSARRPVSLTLPLREEPYESEVLFAFFHGLLSEGVAREIQCRRWRVDERDGFGLLLKTGHDTIGSVVIIEDDGSPPEPRLEPKV